MYTLDTQRDEYETELGLRRQAWQADRLIASPAFC